MRNVVCRVWGHCWSAAPFRQRDYCIRCGHSERRRMF